jgi:DNA invertase Pin-like site-specific DNA recombinase
MVQWEPHDSTVAAPPLPRRAVLYTCASDALGQDRQEAELRHFADTRGFIVGNVYGDNGGRSSREHLIADAQADLFDVVIVADRGCLAVDSRDYDHVRDALTEIGVRLIVTAEEKQF